MSLTSLWTSHVEREGTPGLAPAGAQGLSAAADGQRFPPGGTHRRRSPGAVHLPHPQADQRSVSLAMAAGTPGRVPLPAAIRQMAPPAVVLAGPGVAELQATGPAPPAGGGKASPRRGAADRCDHRRTRQVHQRELAPRRSAALRQYQDVRCASRRVFRPAGASRQPLPWPVCRAAHVSGVGPFLGARPVRSVRYRGPRSMFRRHQGDGCTPGPS